jgi:hypothetical protein
MTQVLTRPRGPRETDQNGHAAHSFASPAARRLQRPRWRDARLMTGILLILVSVALGGRLIGTASHTSGWLGVTRSLPAGHVLVAADLRRVQAHLPPSAGGRYFATDPQALVGKTLAFAVTTGELLPANALSASTRTASRIVPLVVRAGRLPVLSAGDRVDVYVLSKPSGAARDREVRVLADVAYLGQSELSSGDTSVQLRVAPQDAISAIAASRSDRVDLVRVDGDPAGEPGDPGPSSIDGFGGS